MANTEYRKLTTQLKRIDNRILYRQAQIRVLERDLETTPLPFAKHGFLTRQRARLQTEVDSLREQARALVKLRNSLPET